MRLPEGSEALQRDDLPGYGRRHGSDARADGFAAGKHRARPALTEPTTELRPIQPQVVPQDVKQRGCRIDVNRHCASVDSKLNPHVDLECCYSKLGYSKAHGLKNVKWSCTSSPCSIVALSPKSERGRTDHGNPSRERQRGSSERRSGDAAALYLAQRCRPEWTAFRLRARP